MNLLSTYPTSMCGLNIGGIILTFLTTLFLRTISDLLYRDRGVDCGMVYIFNRTRFLFVTKGAMDSEVV